jgi:DNA-binding IclR family transcriptional regulator
MQPNGTDIISTQVLAVRAARARLIFEHGPITLLELAEMADAPIAAVRRTTDELERLGLVKQHGRHYEWKLHDPAQTEKAIQAIAEGQYKPRREAA